MVRLPTSPLKKLLLLFVAWRLSLFILVGLAVLFLPYRPNFAYTRFSFFSTDAWIKNSILEPWANFDGANYLIIARDGYDHEARFFPAYPMSIRFGSFVTGISAHWSHADFVSFAIGMLISNAAFFGAVLVLYKLIRLDYSEKIALWSCVFLIIFPTSFFFVSVYSESLFLLFACSAFWLARKKQWWAAAACAALASANRVVGIFLLPALCVEYWQVEHLSWPIQKVKKNILWLFLAPAGLLGFMLFNVWRFGKWNAFIAQQADLGNSRTVTSFVDPLRVSLRYARILFGVTPQHYEWWTALFEVLAFVFGIAVLYYLWRQKMRLSYLLFALGCFFLPVISGTLSGLPRYVLVIFPFFIGLGMMRSEKMRYAGVFLGVVLSIIFLTLFSRGYYIG